MLHILKEFPPGPLDLYRKKASFDWRKLKLFIDSEEIIKYEVKGTICHQFSLLIKGKFWCKELSCG